jgi:DNA segregation ATPase FtsK/SpoIIIE, S-DNA-T family
VDPARIAVPTPVQKPPPHGFPIVATIAPVALSVVIWLITKSPYALMFAALGPAVAVASVADARRQSAKQSRSETARFEHELRLAREETTAFHEGERRDLDLDAPSAAARLGRGDHDPDRWTATIATAAVTVGRGVRTSSVNLDIPVTRDERSRALTELGDYARVLEDAPVTVPARLGIAVVGPRVPATAVARGLLAQLGALLSPRTTVIAVAAAPEPDDWLTALPHRLVVDATVRPGEVVFREVVFREGEARAAVAVATSVDAVPSHVRVVLRAGETGGIERHPDRSRCTPVTLEYVSGEQARAWAERLAELAGSLAEAGLPESVPLADLLGDTNAPDGSLLAPLGQGTGGVVTVDLVRDGPHAVVGGTTGSGKSELLIAWVLALAHAYPPTAVTFLLVDFKGGSSFAPLAHLPHCVGVISDLDERSAVRALESLKAEIRLRERMLADARARSIEELTGSLPRLVIVVDEFAAMVADYPDLHAVFADLAARGRSLGLHLVLCTQRPAGSVRDAVLANAGVRISLRVNNRADSQAVVGTDAAAELPAQPRGRAFLSVAGESPRELQVALASAADAEAVAARWPGAAAPRRPWRDPLPAVVGLDALDSPVSQVSLESPGGGEIPFGIADLPEQQVQPDVVWNPARDGHVLVVGGARSGKTGALAALGRAAHARIVPPDPERAWDAVVEVLGGIRAGVGDRIMLLDDVDAVLARFSDEHAAAFLDSLAAVLREGPACGVHLVLATQRMTPGLHGIVSLCDRRLLLRMPSKQDHVIAGGASERYDPAAPPGRGTWDGVTVQVALVALPRFEPPAAPRLLEPPLAVVTGSPRAFAQRIAAGGLSVAAPGTHGDVNGDVDVILGDPETWQSHWGALQAANATRPVYFEGCGLADYRMLMRSRALPPPVGVSPGVGWVLEPDGSVSRAGFAGPPDRGIRTD